MFTVEKNNLKEMFRKPSCDATIPGSFVRLKKINKIKGNNNKQINQEGPVQGRETKGEGREERGCGPVQERGSGSGLPGPPRGPLGAGRGRGGREEGGTHGFYLHSGLHQVQPESQSLSHKHVRVMTLIKRLFQLLELPASKIGAGSSSFTARTFFVRVTRV